MSRSSGVPAAQVRDAAPLFAALGDATRLRLLARLSTSGPESISRLASRADVSRQAISKHLDVLAKAGLVRGRRRGRERIWQIEPARLADAHAYLERISRQWDQALDRLRLLVEEP
jgi:DNA-binding transcriptional ArsR family regulator